MTFQHDALALGQESGDDTDGSPVLVGFVERLTVSRSPEHVFGGEFVDGFYERRVHLNFGDQLWTILKPSLFRRDSNFVKVCFQNLRTRGEFQSSVGHCGP